MIIQCEQCSTKFKLDDSKVPEKGVKVRCARCRYVFSVDRNLPESELPSDFGSMLDSSAMPEQETADVQPEFMEPAVTSALEIDEDDYSAEDTFGHDLLEPASLELQDDEQDENDTLFPPDSTDLDHSLISNEEDSLFPPVLIEPKTEIDEMDFGEFDFSTDDNDDASEVSPELDFGDAPKLEPAPVQSHKDDFGGLDFSGDDLFGEVVPSIPEEADEAISFDFGMDDFASSMGTNDSDAGQKSAFSMSDAASDTPFSLDEIDFGDELTSVGVHHVNPEELKPSQELLFAPLAEAQSKPLTEADFTTNKKSPVAQESLPPLSITSRRKQSPVFTVLIAALGIIIAGVIAFFGYSMFAGGKSNTSQESGRITLKDVDAIFVKNKSIGNLLVISGEAVNEFSKPRAAIQIKGLVYGANGEVLASKNAFCGNPLTEEQLTTMSLDKIEAAMSNQFGDSLANMEVAPGKEIPFVIVIAKPPADAKDYGVEPAGSTVATGKTQ